MIYFDEVTKNYVWSLLIWKSELIFEFNKLLIKLLMKFIYLFAKGAYEAKYQFLINKQEITD